MKQTYILAMGYLHKACIAISATCLVVMTIIIPWGVFTRYVLGFGSSWPEPMAILLMIIFAFVSAAACYRDGLHIAVMALPDAVSHRNRLILGWTAEIGMVIANLFMLIWGITLVEATMYQVIAEFPILSVGLTYLPIPVGGALTLLFVIERLWTGAVFTPPDQSSVATAFE